mgnify:CR=1 FL=1
MGRCLHGYVEYYKQLQNNKGSDSLFYCKLFSPSSKKSLYDALSSLIHPPRVSNFKQCENILSSDIIFVMMMIFLSHCDFRSFSFWQHVCGTLIDGCKSSHSV